MLAVAAEVSVDAAIRSAIRSARSNAATTCSGACSRTVSSTRPRYDAGDQGARSGASARSAGRSRCAVFRRDGAPRSDGAARQQRADRRLRGQDHARFARCRKRRTARCAPISSPTTSATAIAAPRRTSTSPPIRSRPSGTRRSPTTARWRASSGPGHAASSRRRALVYLPDGQTHLARISPRLPGRARTSTRIAAAPRPSSVTDVLKRGDIVRVLRDAEGNWALAQTPAAEAALVALDPEDGAIQTLVGGFSFLRSKFNRVTQSVRSPGLELQAVPLFGRVRTRLHAGVGRQRCAARVSRSVQAERPVDAEERRRHVPGADPPARSAGQVGQPRLGARARRDRRALRARIHHALRSRARPDPGKPVDGARHRVGVAAGDGARLRGVRQRRLPRRPVLRAARSTIATARSSTRPTPRSPAPRCPERELAGNATPPAPRAVVRHERAQSDRQRDAPHRLRPTRAPGQPHLAPRAIDARNAYLVTSLMRDVVRRGTGAGAMVLKRNDLAGKTGSTNDHRDAWFTGFNAQPRRQLLGRLRRLRLARPRRIRRQGRAADLDRLHARCAEGRAANSRSTCRPASARCASIRPPARWRRRAIPVRFSKCIKSEDVARLAAQPPPDQQQNGEQREAYDVF